jgi:hypothetical protein
MAKWFGLATGSRAPRDGAHPGAVDRQNRATHHGIAPWTIRPPTIVMTTAVFPTVFGGTEKMS